MRPAAVAAPAVGLLACLLLTGCGGNDGTGDGSAERTPDGASLTRQTCAQVRTGIDAFNTGDFDETVAHFRRAVPLARQAARGHSNSSQQGLLLRAVRYYAALPPEDYPAASASSPAFARWKAVTLGQCVPVDQPSDGPSASDPGITA